MSFIEKHLIDTLVCAYCGKKTAWRYIWEADICLIWSNLRDWPLPGLSPTWRRLIDGACPCKPPAFPEPIGI